MSEADEKLIKILRSQSHILQNFQLSLPWVYGDISRVQALGTGTYHTPWLIYHVKFTKGRQPFLTHWGGIGNEMNRLISTVFFERKKLPQKGSFFTLMYFSSQTSQKKKIKKKD